MTETHTILIVEDDEVNIEILTLDLEQEPYALFVAHTAEVAWEMLRQHHHRISTIMLDRMLPETDGITFMKQLKEHHTYQNLPVIMQTAAASPQQVAEGIEAGVFYYLTKPYDPDLMRSALRAAIREYSYYQGLREQISRTVPGLDILKSCVFELQTPRQARELATFLASFYPNKEQALFGISELLMNAIEHGNLQIGYDLKTRLQQEDRWQQEIERRLTLAEYHDKKVAIHFERLQDRLELTITDEGNGFDWEFYLDIDNERACHTHGRGLALSRLLSFDDMIFRENGRQVAGVVYQ